MSNKGFTLIEALIAFALFAVISIGALRVWRYASQSSLAVIAGADAFENARAAMDAILMNIQLADKIELKTDGAGMLERLKLRELNPEGKPDCYFFYYDADAPKGVKKYHRLEFGLNDEFASQIGEVRLVKDGDLLLITISTDGEAAEPVTLETAADIRHKRYRDG